MKTQSKRRTFSAIVLASVVFLVGCPYNPVPKCNTAMACLSVVKLVDAPGCPNVRPDDQGDKHVLWRAFNDHESVAIRARFLVTLTHHDQSGLPPVERYHASYPDIPSKSRGDLGCEFTTVPTSPGAFDEYSFTPDYACFVNDPACVLPTPITASQAAHDCFIQTQCSGPDCISLDLANATGSGSTQIQQEAAAAAQHMVEDSYVNQVDLSPLLAINGICPKRGKLIVNEPDFTEAGTTCSAAFTVRPTPQLDVVVTLPSRLAGKISRVIHKSATLDFTDPSAAPNLDWQGNNGGNEKIAHIVITKENSGYLIKIAGSLHYCIWIKTRDARHTNGK